MAYVSLSGLIFAAFATAAFVHAAEKFQRCTKESGDPVQGNCGDPDLVCAQAENFEIDSCNYTEFENRCFHCECETTGTCKIVWPVYRHGRRCSPKYTCDCDPDYYGYNCECGALPVVSDGDFVVDDFMVGKPPVTTTANLMCDIGHDLVGTGEITCLSNGTWTATSDTCDIKDCGTITTSVDNGAFVAAGGITTYGGTAALTCTSPCVITGSGSTSLACDASGTWTSSTTPATCEPVESQWCTDNGWEIFRCSCYKFVTEAKSWADAETHCAGLNGGAHLAIIDDVDEDNFLKTKAAADGSSGFYVYGNDIANEGTFVWGSSSDPIVYNGFQTGEPNNSGNQDCILLVDYYNYKWDDFQCYLLKNFICEKDG